MKETIVKCDVCSSIIKEDRHSLELETKGSREIELLKIGDICPECFRKINNYLYDILGEVKYNHLKSKYKYRGDEQ